MDEHEKLAAMKEGAEIAKAIFVEIVSKFASRAEVGAKRGSPEWEHFLNCAATLNALEFEDDDFRAALQSKEGE